MHWCQHSFKKITSNLRLVRIGSNSFQGISYAGKPQVVSSYSFKSMGLIRNIRLWCECFRVSNTLAYSAQHQWRHRKVLQKPTAGVVPGGHRHVAKSERRRLQKRRNGVGWNRRKVGEFGSNLFGEFLSAASDHPGVNVTKLFLSVIYVFSY